MIYRVNLPALPNALIEEIKADPRLHQPGDKDAISFGVALNNNTLDIAEYHFIPFDKTTQLNKEVNEIYSKYFNNEHLGTIVLVFNSPEGIPVSVAAHCDKIRRAGINFLISAGGPDVTTTMYNEIRTTPDLSVSENKPHCEVTVKERFVIPENSWFLIDTQRFHSIDNITGKRILLGIVPEQTNPLYQDLVNTINGILENVA